MISSVIPPNESPAARSRSRFTAILLVAVLTVLLSGLEVGCALTLAYRYADWLILWQLDHYFDLTTVQRHEVEARLELLLARHRQEALPRYEGFLIQIKQRFARGLTTQDLDWIYATYDALRADLFERLVTDGGVFLSSVDQRQVRNLDAALRKDYEQAARLARAPAEERLQKRAEATIDWLEDWLGTLSQEQKIRIVQWSLALPDTQPIWFKYQQARHQELVAFLEKPRTADLAAGELHALFVGVHRTAPPAYQEAVQRMRAGIKAMALSIDRLLTQAQRAHALGKLQTLIDQVHGLQAG